MLDSLNGKITETTGTHEKRIALPPVEITMGFMVILHPRGTELPFSLSTLCMFTLLVGSV